MNHILYLAWRYLVYHRTKTLVLMGSIGLVLFLPWGLYVLVDRGGDTLMARARTTPLIVGPAGSALDVTLSSLYFRKPALEPLPVKEVERVAETGLATGIPLNLRYTVEGHPIVGTTLDYFTFRGLSLVQGRTIAMLGECVLGADAAAALRVTVGDAVISTPAGAFDLAGTFPLKMPVVGICGPTGTADDNAVFVDLKTTWVIAGLGHGHEDVIESGQKDQILRRDADNVVANASVLPYTEITPDNIDSFHFHGDPETFPVDAVIAVPQDRKSGILLRSRYQSSDATVQMIVPLDVIQELLDTVFVIRNYIVLAGIGAAAAALAVTTLVFVLSIRLRSREIETIRKIGGGGRRLVGVLSAEIVLVIVAGVGLAAALAAFASRFGDLLIRIM